MTLTVYLDSSDFSAFSEPLPSPATKNVREELEELQKSGAIRLVFSNVHVAEAAPTTREALALGQARLRAIHDLCWPHSVMASSDLLNDEAASLYGAHSMGQVHRCTGDWLPRDLHGEGIASPLELIQEVLDDAPSPDAKERARRQLLTSSGGLTIKGRRKVLQQVPKLIAEMRRTLPVTPAVEHAIWQHFRSGMVDSQVIRELWAQFRDLRAYAAWLEQDWEGAGRLNLWLRQSGARVREGWERVSREIAQRAEASAALGMSTQEFRATGRTVMAQWKQTAPGKMAQALLGRSDAPTVFEPDEMRRRAPGLAAIASLQLDMAWATVAPGVQPRSPKQSDFADITHVLYLPYVDLFRADRFVAHTIRESSPDLASRVVEKLTALPEAVRARLR